MVASERRDVVALDPLRKRLQAKHVAEFLESVGTTRTAALVRQAQAFERKSRVALGQLEQTPPFSALRHSQLDAGSTVFDQKCFDFIETF